MFAELIRELNRTVLQYKWLSMGPAPDGTVSLVRRYMDSTRAVQGPAARSGLPHLPACLPSLLRSALAGY